jgi:acyl-CoA thioesterase FadM
MQRGEMPALITRNRYVSLGDVDAAGIIYYVSPFRWAEALFSEWLVEVGMSLSSILAAGNGAPAVHAEASYRDSLRLDDLVVAEASVAKLSNRSYTVLTSFTRVGDDAWAVQVQTTHVWVERSLDDDRATVLAAAPVPGRLAGLLEAGKTEAPAAESHR